MKGTVKLKTGTEEAYAKWKAKNTDPYSAECFGYAEAWADLMEAGMAAGKNIAAMAETTRHQADTDGITGFMYGMAVGILARHWEHGEALRLWHNLKTQIHRDEGEKANESGGVLNPALLNIK